MSQLSKRWLSGGLVAGAACYALYVAQARQAALLTHLTALETRLAARNECSAQAEAALLHSMRWYVCRTHNQAADLAVLAVAQQTQTRTQALVDTLRRVRQLLRAGHRPTAALRRLPTLLDGHKVQRIAPDTPLPAQPPLPAGSASWLGEFWLDAEPAAAALANLTYLEIQVRVYAADALAAQAQKVGESSDYLSIIQPAAIPASEVVRAGSMYEARLLLLNERWLPSTEHPYCIEQFYADGKPLTRTYGGGQLVVAVPAWRPGQPDTLRRQWQGRIQATGYYRDTVVQVTVPYFIIKPKSR